MTYDQMHAALIESMPGFSGLIQPIQGFLVGDCLATGTVLATPDVATTLAVTWGLWTEAHDLTGAWGIEA